MADNQGNKKKYGTISKAIIVIYLIELIWFFYSQIFKPWQMGVPLDVASVDLAVILVIGLIVLIAFFMFKKSKKVSATIFGILLASVIIFGVIAPIFDVYIPFFWHLFHPGK